MKQIKLLAPCLLLYLTSIVQAGDYGNWAMATVYGYNGNSRPMVVNNFTPPYFALHPPVYYGERYYRPYGDSPFASWPQLQPNPAYMPRTQPLSQLTTIENPHCPAHVQAMPVFPQVPSLPSQIEPALPQTIQPNSAAPQPSTPKPESGKVPDVVRSQPTGPITIENPYFVEPGQYIKKSDLNSAAN